MKVVIPYAEFVRLIKDMIGGFDEGDVIAAIGETILGTNHGAILHDPEFDEFSLDTGSMELEYYGLTPATVERYNGLIVPDYTVHTWKEVMAHEERNQCVKNR